MTYFIGVSGGSSSGKTTLARKLQNLIGCDRCAILHQDNYYHDQQATFAKNPKAQVNFDHPDAIDFALLVKHLDELRSKKNIEVPLYDFKLHGRLDESLRVQARPIVIIEGFLVLHHSELVARLNNSLFLDIDEKIRFHRRLTRDALERGRDVESITQQFYHDVKPMHDLFVQPSISRAKHIIHNHKNEDLILQTLMGEIKVHALTYSDSHPLEYPKQNRILAGLRNTGLESL